MGRGQVHVAMPMTMPACPMEELSMERVYAGILRESPEAVSVVVDLVWGSAWMPDDESGGQGTLGPYVEMIR